jgi:uncharacterized protein YbjT (DUF2867 family)
VETRSGRTLVAGATGGLGFKVCEALVRRRRPFTTLVRPTSDPAKVEWLRALGAEVVVGDLELPETLPAAVAGIDAVITTASVFPVDPRPDAIDRLDRRGSINLVEAAAAAGVRRFVYTSVPPVQPDYEFQQAKRAVEASLVASGMEYAILRPGTFMDVWFTPLLDFDLDGGAITIYGDGSAEASWISSTDVAEYAVWALDAEAAGNAILDLGGPEAVTYEEIAAVYEELTGRPFTRTYVPAGELERRYAEATMPTERSFHAVMLSAARGGVTDMTSLTATSDIRLTTVREFVAVQLSRNG